MTQNTHRELTCCVRRYHFAIVSFFSPNSGLLFKVSDGLED